MFLFFNCLTVVVCLGATTQTESKRVTCRNDTRWTNGFTSLNGVPSTISSDRERYTCTGNACEHIKLVTCRRSDTKWKCDTIHKKKVVVFKPKVSCISEGVKGVSCGVAVHTKNKTLTAAETIVGGVTMVFLCILLGPTMFAAVLFGVLLGGDSEGYTSTSYDDC